jgi:hypothetical protein
VLLQRLCQIQRSNWNSNCGAACFLPDLIDIEFEMLQFPFWLVLPTGAPSPQQLTGYGVSHPQTFSSAEKMAAFLTNHKHVQWETKLVDRYSAVSVLSKLVTHGFPAICHDSHEDGSGGTSISIADVLAAMKT